MNTATLALTSLEATAAANVAPADCSDAETASLSLNGPANTMNQLSQHTHASLPQASRPQGKRTTGFHNGPPEVCTDARTLRDSLQVAIGEPLSYRRQAASEGDAIEAEWRRLNWDDYHDIGSGLVSLIADELLVNPDHVTVKEWLVLDDVGLTATPYLSVKAPQGHEARLWSPGMKHLIDRYLIDLMRGVPEGPSASCETGNVAQPGDLIPRSGKCTGGESPSHDSPDTVEASLADLPAAPAEAKASRTPDIDGARPDASESAQAPVPAAIEPKSRNSGATKPSAEERAAKAATTVLRRIGGRTLDAKCTVKSPLWESVTAFGKLAPKPKRARSDKLHADKQCHIDGYAKSKREVYLVLAKGRVTVSFDTATWLKRIVKFAAIDGATFCADYLEQRHEGKKRLTLNNLVVRA